MKKFLSILLVLAMAISCVSMVTINAGQDPAAQGMSIEWSNKSTTGNYYKSGENYLTTKLGYATTYTGDVKVAYAISNLGTSDVTVDASLQATVSVYKSADSADKKAAWASPDGKYGTVTVKPGESQVVTYTITAANGKVNGTYGDPKKTAQDVDLEKFFLRFNVAAGDESAHKIVIASVGEKADVETAAVLLAASSGSTNFGAVPTAGATPNPGTITLGTCDIPVITVTNGDAELGTDAGWPYSNAGGKVTAIDTDKHAGNYSFQYDATAAANKWNYSLFDLTGAIADVPALGYTGGGVGEYTVEFWAKASAADTYMTTGIVFGGLYKDQASLCKEVEGSDTNKANYLINQINSTPITLGTEWTKYSLTFNVTDKIYQQYLNLLTVKKSADGKDVNYKTIGLRLDGSASAVTTGENQHPAGPYADGTYTVKYYLDDITITKKTVTPSASATASATASPSPSPSPEPTGVATQITFKSTATSAYFNTKTGYLTDSTVEGTISKKFTIYNPGTKDFQAQIRFQTLHNGGWYGPAADNYVTVPAGEAVEYTATLPVSNSKVSVSGGTPSTEAKYDVSAFFARLDIKGTDLKDAVAVIAPESGLSVASTLSTGLAATAYEVTAITQLPDISLNKGVKFTINDVVSETGTQTHYLRLSNTATANELASRIKNNKIALNYTIYNTSSKTIKVRLYAQSGWNYIYANGGTTNNYVEVAANSYKDVTYEIDVYNNNDTGKVNKVKLASGAYADLSTLGYRVDVATTDSVNSVNVIGSTFIIAPEELSDITYLQALEPATAAKTNSTYSLKAVKELPEKENKTTVVNGNVELNTTAGWGKFNAGSTGSVEVVTPGANSTGHAIKFSGAQGAYASVAFELQNAILDDTANGYSGGGAGKYKVTFYAKAESGKSGTFRPFLNSQKHAGASNVPTEYAGTKVDTYIGSGSVNMTDAWQKFEVTFSVSQDYLDELKFFYNDKGIEDAYKIILRLDGHDTGSAFETTRFDYFIDEVTIEKVVEATPSPTATSTATASPSPSPTATATPNATTKGAKLTVDSTVTVANKFQIMTSSNGGYLNDVAITTGTITKNYTIYNTSTVPFNVFVSLQALTKPTAGGSNTWKGPNSAQSKEVTIQPGGYADFTITLDVADGTVEIPGCESRTLDKFFFRIDVTGLITGDTLVLADADAPKGIPTSLSKVTTELLTQLPNKVEVTATPSSDPTNTPEPTATPYETQAPAVTLSNGNAENGTTNWSAMNNAVISSVTGGANGTSNAIFVDTTNADQWGSVLFNLGPAIIQDSLRGYNGSGAGTYHLSFYTKATTGNGGKFSIVLNSKYHKSASELSEYGELAQSTYVTYSSFEMTDGWTKVEADITIKQSYLDLIKALYNAGNKDAYILNLRLDGSGQINAQNPRAFNTSRFNYYIDEVEFALSATPVATMNPALVKGAKLTVASSITDASKKFQMMTSSNGGYLNDVAITDGTLTKSYTVYNTSTVPLTVAVSLQALTQTTAGGTNTWAGPASAQSKAVTIQAGGYADFTLSLEVCEDEVEIPGCASRTLDKFFFRIDVTGAIAGDTIVVADADAPKGIPETLTNATVEKVDALPNKVEVTPTPKSIQPVVLSNGDVESGTTKNWSAMNNTTIKVVEPGANGSAYAIYADNSKADQYGSVLFDLGPAIIDDAENGYSGHGAGTYYITYYVKAEAGKGGKFSTVLNCKVHKSASQLSQYGALAQSTYISLAGFEMTDQWQKVTTKVEISASFIKLLKNMYADGETDAYILNLRIDGSGETRAFGTERFNYYIDDANIEYDTTAPTPVAEADEEDAIGTLFQFSTDNKSAYLTTSSKGGYFTDEVETGTIKKGYTIYNTSDHELAFEVSFQTTAKTDEGKDTWAGPGSTKISIPANSAAFFYVTMKVENGKVKVTAGKNTAEYELSSFFFRVNISDVKAGDSFIIVPQDKADLVKGAAGSTKNIFLVDSVPDYEIDDTTIKKIANGNAENGTKNWGVFSSGGGTIEQVEGGAKSTAHSIKYTPGTSKYGSIAFDLGPAIFKDVENGYNGGGAGVYKIVFYARADKEATFSLILNCQYHQSAANLAKYGSLAQNTYISLGKKAELTTKWQKFEVEVEMTDTMYKLCQKLYADGTSAAYQWFLRLDGSGKGFAYENLTATNPGVSYYMDEVSITKTYKKVPVGVKFTATEEIEASQYIVSQAGVLSSSNVKDDVCTKSFKVTNNGEEDIQISLSLQVTHKKSDGSNTWVGPHSGEMIVIEPGMTEVLEYEMDVEDGKVTIDSGGNEAEYDLSKFFARFDVRNGDGQSVFEEGTSFTISANEKDCERIFKGTIANKAKWNIEYIYAANSKQSKTGDVLPVSVIATTMLATIALVVVSKKKKETM